ncbi:MAG: ABC transporter permease [Burkholderiaceae bacterium]
MKIAPLLLVALLLLLVWQAIVSLTGAPPYILPDPLRVFRALVDNADLIGGHAVITALEVLIGLVLGTALGAMTALWLKMSPTARSLLLPAMVLSQSVPVFALAPLLTLWFGYGLWSKIAMTTLIIYFPVASTFYDGLRNTPAGLDDLATVMGATPLRRLFLIQVPAAIPSLASGLRLAAIYAPIGAVIGEWVGASQGLGYLMLLANGRVKTDLMFAALLVLAVMAMALHFAISLLARRLQQWAGVG